MDGLFDGGWEFLSDGHCVFSLKSLYEIRIVRPFDSRSSMKRFENNFTFPSHKPQLAYYRVSVSA
jgi:hypothetical protein